RSARTTELSCSATTGVPPGRWATSSSPSTARGACSRRAGDLCDPCGSSASGSLRLEIRLRPRRDRTRHASGHLVRVRVSFERRARRPSPRASDYLVRGTPRRVADCGGCDRGHGCRRAGRPPVVRAAGPASHRAWLGVAVRLPTGLLVALFVPLLIPALRTLPWRRPSAS